MNSIILEKRPLLRRKGFNYTLPSPFRVQDDKQRKGDAMKNGKQDILLQTRQNSATAMQEIHSEENQNVSVGRSKMDIILPLKPGCHTMPFYPNNCRTDYDYFMQKDKNSLDSLKEHLKYSKQTSNRRQEKNDKRKLEHFDTDFSYIPRERCETNSKLLNGYKISHKGRLYENEIRLTKEIHKKEILLQEKLLKAMETLGKVQIRSESEDKMKEEQRNTWRSEIRLNYTEKGNWDWKSDRDRSLVGRRHEGQQEEFNNLFKGEDGIKREENGVKDTNVRQKERRNIHRTTKTEETELDYFEKMTRHMRKTEQTEKDKTKRERAVEWQRSEMRKWDQSDWQEKEIVRAYDGEKRRRERANFKKHTDKEDEDQRWNIMEKIASNSPIKGKGVFNHDKKDVLIKNHLATQDRVYRYNNRAAEEMPFKLPLPNDDQNTESLQQVQPIPENSSDLDFQLFPCKICNRKFKKDRLEKHISICQKTQKPKCKVYDSSQHRIKGTELEEFIKKNGRSKTPEPKKNKKHDAFIQNIRQARVPAARGFQPREDPYSDYVTCPHCSRRFAPGPSETHIPKCQNIKSRPPPPRQRHQI